MIPPNMHTQTLLYVTNILSLLMTLVMFAAWRFNSQVPGLREWTAACAASVLVTIFFLLNPGFPTGWMALAMQFFMLVTSWLTWLGTRLYMGRPPARWWSGPLLLISTLLIAGILSRFDLVPGLRILLTSMVSGAFYMQSARTIRVGDQEQFPARYFVGLTSLVHSIFVWLRPLLVWIGLHESGFSAIEMLHFSILESMLFVILLGLGSVMLAAESISSELRLLSQRDELTEIFNRRAFLAVLDKAISASQRSGIPLAIMVIDLDHFKQINDRWGHQAGDEVLRSFTETTSTCLRNEDVIGRLGGEEFAILVAQARLDEAIEIAQRLRAAAQADVVSINGNRIPYTVSIGLTQFQDGDNSETLLHRADQAMYRAKQAGRNRVET